MTRVRRQRFKIKRPIVAAHNYLRMKIALNILATARMVEMKMSKDHIFNLCRVEASLFHAANENVARLIFVIQRVKKNITVLRCNKPRADAAIADPIKIVEEPLQPERHGRARRWIRSQVRKAVRHANRRPVGVRCAARRFAEYAKIELQVGIVPSDRFALATYS